MTVADDLDRRAHALTRDFYRALRTEVVDGNPDLDAGEQAALRGHYEVMNRPDRYPPALAEAIYVRRRREAVRAVLARPGEWVLDAGCGFGSESFLFAAAGARVIAVDLSPAQIAVAGKRRRHFEKETGRPPAVEFTAADLDRYTPPRDDLALTWIAGVLAAVGDQDGLLRRIAAATPPGGLLMVTDMNLLNPWMLLREWQRRRRMALRSPAFAAEADFAAMFQRHERRGARYFDAEAGDTVDDVQFFWFRTLDRLLRAAGFTPNRRSFSGFLPPLPGLGGLSRVEAALGHVPLLRTLGYFYLMTAVRNP